MIFDYFLLQKVLWERENYFFLPIFFLFLSRHMIIDQPLTSPSLHGMNKTCFRNVIFKWTVKKGNFCVFAGINLKNSYNIVLWSFLMSTRLKMFPNDVFHKLSTMLWQPCSEIHFHNRACWETFDSHSCCSSWKFVIFSSKLGGFLGVTTKNGSNNTSERCHKQQKERWHRH